MNAANICTSFILTLVALGAQAQTNPPQSEDEFTKQTAFSKAQQAYYDQQLLTAKSQQAAAEANIAVQTASLTAANQLQAAKYSSDLALSSAIKDSGLSAATGKDGTIAIAASEKTMLALQRDSLVVIDTISTSVCKTIEAKLPKDDQGNPLRTFIAPANYEALVQKSVPDIIQLTSLHEMAVKGSSDFKTAQMELAGAAVAGAMVSAQYIAGGIQALTKLFRTDYNLGFTATNRQALFEQTLAITCQNAVLSNVEGKQRLSATKVLYAWLDEMARFVQLYDNWSEQTSLRKTELTGRKTEIAAQAPTTKKGKSAKETVLKQIENELKELSARETTLAKYKLVSASIKAYLAGIGSSTVYDSLVWGQSYLHKSGGLPADVENLKLETLPRLSYTLSVQDSSIKATSTFFADKVRHFATAEIYFSLISSKGDPLVVGVLSNNTLPKDFKVKEIQGENYEKVYSSPIKGTPPPEPTAPVALN